MLYMEKDDLLAQGRSGLNLLQFPDPKEYRLYDRTIFEALSDWTQQLLEVNQIRDISQAYHKHSAPEQLIVPAEASQPLVIVQSIKRAMEISKAYKPNDNYRDAGYLVPLSSVRNSAEVSISVAPTEISTEFRPLFSMVTQSSQQGSYSSYMIGDERWSIGGSRGLVHESSNYSNTLDRKLQPEVKGILALLGYDDTAFQCSKTKTFGEYQEEICASFDSQSHY